jgi:class 3 adenylate cyclase
MSLEGLGDYSPEIRASDSEREYVVDVLRAHCSDGRIDLDEFSERINRVYAARTIGELNEITSDLPVPVAADDLVGTREAGRTRQAIKWTIGILSGPRRRGRWRVEGETNVVAFMGGAHLDLRDAEIAGDEITIRCFVMMGGIEIVVPEGIEVHVSGIPFMGGFENKIADVPVLPGTPVIRVTGFAVMGGVDVKSKASPAEEKQRKEERRQQRQQRRSAMRDVHDARSDARREVHEAIQQAKLEAIQQAREATKRALAAIPDLFPEPPRPPRQTTRPAASRPPADPPAAPSPSANGNPAPEGTVTLLVTDIEGSTEMTEDLGDIRWVRLLNKHNELVRACVHDHSGIELKHQGDGFLLAFPSARKALLCAVQLQRAFHDDDLPVRMGLHTGEVIREGDDLYGRNVILATRIAGVARGGEILVSSLTKELTDSSGDLEFSDDREMQLKGLNGTFRVWSLGWK